MNSYNIHILTNMMVNLQSQNNYDQHVLNGKLFVNQKKRQASFTQNRPRGPRSIEMMRTPHSRLVRRPDGDFTLTFHFSKEEYAVGPQLLEELQKVVDFLSLNPSKRQAA
jgi:hypothetical protein